MCAEHKLRLSDLERLGCARVMLDIKRGRYNENADSIVGQVEKSVALPFAKHPSCLLPRDMIRQVAGDIQIAGKELAAEKGWGMEPDGYNFAELIWGQSSVPDQVVRTGKTWAEIVWERRQKGNTPVIYKNGTPFMQGFPYKNKLVVVDLNFTSFCELNFKQGLRFSQNVEELVCSYAWKLGFPKEMLIDTRSYRDSDNLCWVETRAITGSRWEQFKLKYVFEGTSHRYKPSPLYICGFSIVYNPT